MDENAAASLALDAYQALEGIGEDVAQIKAGNSDVLAAIESLRQTLSLIHISEPTRRS